MFIQPNVMAANATLWAELSTYLHYRREDARTYSAGASGNAVSNNGATHRVVTHLTPAPAELKPTSPWQAPSLPQAE